MVRARVRTLRRVILPILRPAVATSMVYAFVRAITSVSAVIFLVSGEYNLATVYIVGRAEYGEYGLAIVYSAVLIVIMLLALLAIQALVGERRIGRRDIVANRRPTQNWQRHDERPGCSGPHDPKCCTRWVTLRPADRGAPCRG